MDEAKQPGITIGQIFLRSASFGHREDVMSLAPNTSVGEISLIVKFSGMLDADEKTGLIVVGVSTNPDQNPLYRLGVEMAALVEQEKGAENMSLREFLNGSAPALLYPFLREIVANLTWRGRFGPIWLKPINVKPLIVESAWEPVHAEQLEGKENPQDQKT